MSSLFQKLAGLSFMKVVFVLILRKASFESRLLFFYFALKCEQDLRLLVN